MTRAVKFKGVIEGSPREVGLALFDKVILPCLEAISSYPEQERARFYASLVGSIMGAMGADFGPQNAKVILEGLIAAFDRVAGEMELQPETKH